MLSADAIGFVLILAFLHAGTVVFTLILAFLTGDIVVLCVILAFLSTDADVFRNDRMILVFRSQIPVFYNESHIFECRCNRFQSVSSILECRYCCFYMEFGILACRDRCFTMILAFLIADTLVFIMSLASVVVQMVLLFAMTLLLLVGFGNLQTSRVKRSLPKGMFSLKISLTTCSKPCFAAPDRPQCGVWLLFVSGQRCVFTVVFVKTNIYVSADIIIFL